MCGAQTSTQKVASGADFSANIHFDSECVSSLSLSFFFGCLSSKVGHCDATVAIIHPCLWQKGHLYKKSLRHRPPPTHHLTQHIEINGVKPDCSKSTQFPSCHNQRIQMVSSAPDSGCAGKSPRIRWSASSHQSNCKNGGVVNRESCWVSGWVRNRKWRIIPKSFLGRNKMSRVFEYTFRDQNYRFDWKRDACLAITVAMGLASR